MNEDLLIKYLTHTATEKDMRMIEQWISADNRNSEWLFEIERVWSLKDELKYSDRERINVAYSRFISGLEKESEKHTNKHRPVMMWARDFMKYAAVVVCTLTISFGIFKLNTPDNYTVEEYNKIEVPNGQRASLTLSDGTKVWLNSQSKLTYPASFNGEERKVKLEGEGFFEVSHNPEKPFIVDGELLEVKVLGTKFNYRSYKDEDAAVTLSEGKVEVSTYDGENNLTLKPTEQVVYSSKTGITLNKGVDLDLMESWTVGETVFQDQPLSLICKELERKFDVVIEVTDSHLAEEKFTCHFKENLNIQQVMNLLKATRQLDYTVSKNKIIIQSSKAKV